MRDDLPPDWRWGDPVPDEAHPGIDRRLDLPVRSPATTRRAVYGRVYELFTDDPRDGEHPYVGQTTTTIAQRVKRHKSADEIAKRPWKARIVDGPRGYRLLETVYSTGDCADNERDLDRAEAFWIDRLRPTHNDVRPVRPRQGDPLPPRPKESRGSRPKRPRRRVNWRLSTFLTITILCVALVARLLTALHLPWPWVPWALSLPIGAAFAYAAFSRLLTAGRRLKIWR